MKQALSLNEMVDEQDQRISEVCRVQEYPGQNSQQAAAVLSVTTEPMAFSLFIL